MFFTLFCEGVTKFAVVVPDSPDLEASDLQEIEIKTAAIKIK